MNDPEIFTPSVNAAKLNLKDEYVCWIDIMGTRNIMSESIQKAANFILRFHSCVIDAIGTEEQVRYYPLMDGVFITAPNAEIITKIISMVFYKTASLFLTEDRNGHRFIIKGSLAYGQIAHGNTIDNDICPTISANDSYRNTLMLGMPMIQAISSERIAPPFGVFIHESARKYKVLQGKYYMWTSPQAKKIDKTALKTKVISYFEWCERFIEYQEMDSSKVKTYKQLTNEYFGDMMETD